MATEHAASESPATTGKANWAGRKQDRNGPNGVSSRRKENDLSWATWVIPGDLVVL